MEVSYGVKVHNNYSMGVNTDLEKRINKAFTYILKSSPNFYMARNVYNTLKSKDLTRSVCPGDLIKKTNVIKEFELITKIDTMSKNSRVQNLRERITLRGSATK